MDVVHCCYSPMFVCVWTNKERDRVVRILFIGKNTQYPNICQIPQVEER